MLVVALKSIVHGGHVRKAGQVFEVFDRTDAKGLVIHGTAENEGQRLCSEGYARFASRSEEAGFLQAPAAESQ